MKEINLTKLIKDNYVYFDSLRQGFAYYTIIHKYIDPIIPEEDYDKPEVVERFSRAESYSFTIPLDDIGNGTLRAKMKAIEVLRWIRKAHESGELIKIT